MCYRLTNTVPSCRRLVVVVVVVIDRRFDRRRKGTDFIFRQLPSSPPPLWKRRRRYGPDARPWRRSGLCGATIVFEAAHIKHGTAYTRPSVTAFAVKSTKLGKFATAAAATAVAPLQRTADGYHSPRTAYAYFYRRSLCAAHTIMCTTVMRNLGKHLIYDEGREM